MDETSRRRWLARWPWAVLAVPALALVVAAATFDRSAWPSVMGDEATYLMQAESLAWDLDLAYSLADYRRFVEHWDRPPQGLILQSGDGGGHVQYGKPPFYALYLAPFARLAPARGPFVANALLLGFTCFWAAAALARRIGRLAPLWVAVWVFASVAFGQVFWAHPDLFLMCLTALGLALAFEAPEGETGRRAVARWLAIGLLLAVVAYSRPPYLSLFLPALAALPRRGWKVAGPALAAGALAVFVAMGSLHQALVGSWTSYGAERMGFYEHTGFPGVDFPVEAWAEKLGELGNVAAADPTEIDWGKRLAPSLWGWNAVYFTAGRHVGVLPYFLPLVLGFLASAPPGRSARVKLRRFLPSWDRRVWSLVLAVVLACGAFLILRPFNFYGGGGAIANRYFLPLYPALWFLVRRPLALGWLAATAAVAGLFVWELWLHPRSYPITAERDYRYVSPAAARWLPYETTLSHLKLAGREDLYPGIFVRLLSPEIEPGDEGSLRLGGGVEGRLLLGGLRPLAAVDVEIVGVSAADRVELDAGGAEVEPLPPGTRFRVRPGDPVARHPMWWSRWEPAYLYRLTLRFDSEGAKAVAFRLSPAPEEAVPGGV